MTADLMHRAQAGDVDAFAQIYRRYRPEVYRYAYSRLPRLAEDITQDVFVKALAAIGTYRDMGRDPGAWLRTITANLCRDRVKSSEMQRTSVTRGGELPEPPPVPDPVDALVDGLVCRDALVELAELRPEQREALVLYYLRDLSVADVAERIGCRQDRARMLLFRARRSMGALLGAGRAVADA